jgi:hypothetical protein
MVFYNFTFSERRKIMATGRQLVETLVEYATLSTGKGFTAHLDLDHGPAGILRSPEPDIAAREAASIVIQKRMATAKTLTEKLTALCRQSGVIWIHPERGMAFQTGQQLTADEEMALAALQQELARIDTFINL